MSLTSEFEQQELGRFFQIYPRLIVIVGIPLILVFSFTDYFYSKELYFEFLLIRSLASLAMMSLAVLSKMPRLRSINYFFLDALGIIAMCMIVMLSAKSGGVQSAYLYGAYLAHATIMAFFLVPARRIILSSSLIFLPEVIYLLLVVDSETAWPVLFNFGLVVSFIAVSYAANKRAWNSKLTEYAYRSKLEIALHEKETKLIKIQALAELSRQVAHDIRAPLGAMAVLLGELNLSSDKTNMYRAIISRFTSIANKLLDSSRSIEDDRYKNSKSDIIDLVEVKGIIESVIVEKNLRHAGNIQLIDGKLLNSTNMKMTFDKVELGVLLSNILENAIEANLYNKPIFIKAKLIRNDVVIQIEDSGKGMSPELLKRLEQGAFSYGKINGNGIGLKHARDVLTKHGGYLRIESDLMKGTVVTLLFRTHGTS